MSASTNINTPSNTPVTRRVRAYFAPVDRSTGTPTLFDPAQQGRFDLNAPPAPWLDLGWCANFRRGDEGTHSVMPLRIGAQAMVSTQIRTGVDATVALEFGTWGKLQLALSCGTQQMNLLAADSSTAASPSGGEAVAAVALDSSSTASTLVIGEAASQFTAGDCIVVDADYTGQTGFVGAGVSGAFIRTTGQLFGVDYIRRISLNVARIASIDNGTLTLEQPLLAGAPALGIKLSRVIGFTDRIGSAFFQEWSALFVKEGEQGDRILFHYPRLQAMQDA
ncbi:MAG TPA: hypothetical protein VIM60_00865, partial [Edaphobacter sp.]